MAINLSKERSPCNLLRKSYNKIDFRLAQTISMSTPGYHRKEQLHAASIPLTTQEILELPLGTELILHTHMSKGDQFAGLVKNAQRHGGDFVIKPYRAATLERGIMMELALHDGRAAMNYPLVLTGEPKIIKPEDGRHLNKGRAKRKKENPELPPWLLAKPLHTETKYGQAPKSKASRKFRHSY
jgi:hypothetical protein